MEDIKFLIQKLEAELSRTQSDAQIKAVGRIMRVGDGVVWISGLPDAQLNEVLLVKTEDKKTPVLALNLEEDLIGAVFLQGNASLKEGDVVMRTKQIIQVPVGKQLLGRVITPLGDPLDGKGTMKTNQSYALEREAPGVIERAPVRTPLHTGIKIIDALIPIGRGQRELILGDRQIGKTSIALDIILHQKNDHIKRPICVYVAVGQKLSKVRRMYEVLKEEGALEYTIIVATAPSDAPALLYLAPYAGCAIGEYFRDMGEDVVVVYDDLTKHAWSWRELSLLLKRPVGREAYPGDIFYTHSRLLERAANVKESGSLTALPICETQLGDISSYIPTNLISITDGQIYLESELFNAGFRPAISVGLSVSRVGSQAQTKAMKRVAGKLKLDLAQLRELEAFAQVTTDLAPESKQKLLRGKIILEILKQENLKTVGFEKLVVLLFGAVEGLWDGIELSRMRQLEQDFFVYLESAGQKTLKAIREKQEVTKDIEDQMRSLIEAFRKKIEA